MNEPNDTALRDAFLNGMSRVATTVNVVTTDGPKGRGGLTVSAMSSVSVDSTRPTLLICVNEQSPMAARITGNGVFCVNVLGADQRQVSDAFAGWLPEGVTDKFECSEWVTMASGAPRMAAPLVAFDCHVVSAEKVGTHHVFIAEVGEVFDGGDGAPLVYANRDYGALAG